MMLARRIAVCGGRRFNDKDWLFAEMDKLRAEIGDFAVVTGGQRDWSRLTRQFSGADYWAEEWARARQLWYLGLTADWTGGLGGGPRRNRRVLAEAQPHGLMAFPGGKGTADMIRAAHEAGIKVRIITYPLRTGEADADAPTDQPDGEGTLGAAKGPTEPKGLPQPASGSLDEGPVSQGGDA